MLIFVTHRDHEYTLTALSGPGYSGMPTHRIMSYDALFAEQDAPAATYIFCDHERLSDLDLVTAAEAADALAAAGMPVLNHPARVKIRYALLRALHDAGINDFDCYRADGQPRPARFPVFVRAEAMHDAPETGLLENQQALDAALQNLVAKGRPLRGLLVIEFAGEAVKPGLFRRWGVFGIGGTISLTQCVSQDSWNVKHGTMGLASEDLYRDDDDAVRSNRYADVVGHAFQIAGIDYGRADFGLLNGLVQIFEINTNPYFAKPEPHPSAVRTATDAFAVERLMAMFAAIPQSQHQARVRLDGERISTWRWSAQQAAKRLYPQSPPAFHESPRWTTRIARAFGGR